MGSFVGAQPPPPGDIKMRLRGVWVWAGPALGPLNRSLLRNEHGHSRIAHGMIDEGRVHTI